MKVAIPNWLVVALVLCLVSFFSSAGQSAAEKAGFSITPELRAAMNMPGAETPKAWLGNAIQYDYQTDPANIDVGQKYRLPEARRRCAKGDIDSCATARDIEKWLSWAKSASLRVSPACDRTPCGHVPDNLVPAALKGKYWVLHAWASWCPYCRLDHQRFVEIGADRQLSLVSLVHQDTEAAAARYLAKNGNPYAGGSIHVSSEIQSSLDLHRVPATYVINPDGNIQERFQGSLTDNEQKALEKYF